LIDVTPLSLGLETLGGVFTRLINKNTNIPTTKSQTFTTAVDGQTTVEVKVYQGEREMCADNKLLGEFKLVGIRAAPKGSPQIEVQFDIDANGIVTVRATDKDTGKAQEIRIQSSGGLSSDEIQRIILEAEKNKEGDAKRKHLIEANNRADSVIEDTESTLRKLKEHLSSDDQEKVRKLIEDTRAKKGVDPVELETSINELQSESLRIFEPAWKLLKEKENATSSGSPKDGNDKGTVDAEYTDVKKD